MLVAVAALGALALVLGFVLGYGAIRFRVESDPVVDKVDALLPQTQCGQCSYAGCRPYAEAMVAGEADINRCAPGGDSAILALADLLGRDPVALDEDVGEHKARAVAVIDEQWCIGCTLCIQACPVDAILGASKQMHTVIAEECTGCELCLDPCPVDCIRMVPLPESISAWKWPCPESSVEVRG